MANLTSRSYFQLWVIAAFLLFQNTSRSHLRSPENHPPLFIFGDSLFDTGNNNNPTSSACYWPYGETFFKHSTGRASDGRLIPDFIAEYAKLPFPLPYRQTRNRQLRYGVNFASGGAEVLGVNPDKIIIHLKGQLSNFKNVKKRLRHKLGDSETEALLSKAIYLFSFGTNDYAKVTDDFSVLHYYSSEEYVGMVVGNFTTGLKEIYKNGGRKFAFVSLGAVGCLPNMRAKNSSGGCMEQVTVLVKLHNKAFFYVLMKLQKQLQGFKYSNFDFYNSLSRRIKHPSKYGFKEAKTACCGTGPFRGIKSCGGVGTPIKEFEVCDDPSEYLFFDSHPSEKANHQFSKLMWRGSVDVTRPYNLKQLFQL